MKHWRLAFATTLLFTATAFLNAADLGFVTDSKGIVEYQHSGQPGWTAVKGKVFLVPGDSLRTGPNGDISLMIDLSSKQIKLKPDSQVTFNGATGHYFADLKEGTLICQIKKMNTSQTFQVRTPVAVAAVRGTTFTVQYISAKRWGAVEVTEGTVEVTKAKEHTQVTAGQRIEFLEKQPLGQPIAIPKK